MTSIPERALYLSRPHVERLVDICDEGWRVEGKAYRSEMQPVGVLPEIVGCILLPSVLLELCGVIFLMSPMEVACHQGLRVLVMLLVGKRVPPPVAHCSERHPLAVQLRECLQSCGVNRKGKPSVADG